MAKRPIPFPHLDPAAEPEPIVKHRGGIVIRLASSDFNLVKSGEAPALLAATSIGECRLRTPVLEGLSFSGATHRLHRLGPVPVERQEEE
jgi:hypothetical protein